MIYVAGIFAVAVGVFLDQFTKYLAANHLKEQSIPIIEGVFRLQYLENRGAAFGLLQNQQLFFLLVGIITLVLIAYLYVRIPHTKRFLPLRICMVSIVAGAVGNTIDRIRLEYVIDFLYFELIDFPIFNVADIYATVATFGLIILFLFYYKEEDLDVVFDLFSRNRKREQE